MAPFSISSPTSDTCCSLLELYSVEEMDYLLENKVQESQSGSFVCLLCGVVIKVRNNLRRHFRLRHVEQRERFRCPPCDKGPSINDVRKILGLFDSTLSPQPISAIFIFWTTPRWCVTSFMDGPQGPAQPERAPQPHLPQAPRLEGRQLRQVRHIGRILGQNRCQVTSSAFCTLFGSFSNESFE